VGHEGAKSFTSARRARLRADHERILVNRHPRYSEQVREYLWCSIDPVDAFADVLSPRKSSSKASDPHRAVLVVATERPRAAVANALSALAHDHRLTILTTRAKTRRWRAAVSAAEVLAFGSEEGRVWDIALDASEPGSEAALRAAHAAPRLGTLALLETEHPSHELSALADRAVDDELLRSLWSENAERMLAHGVPRPSRPSLRARAISAADRVAPRLMGALRRVTKR
jgi:hypothetical protein